MEEILWRKWQYIMVDIHQWNIRKYEQEETQKILERGFTEISMTNAVVEQDWFAYVLERVWNLVYYSNTMITV